MQPFRTAGVVTLASILVTLLISLSFVAAWRRAEYALVFMFAGSIGAAALASGVIVFASRLRDVESRVDDDGVRRTLEQALDSAGVRVEPAQADTTDLAARLAEVNEELQTFTWSVSHDLRAPLRTIDGFARELQLDPDSHLSPAAVKSLGRIRAASWRMTALIDGLLTLARASSSELRRERVDLSAIARSVAGELAHVHGSRDLTFVIADDLHAVGDPHLLRVVFDNLLGNAVKFTSKQERARITVGAEDGEFFVSDDGAGFDSRLAGNLFVPFQRLHSAADFEGSGIGLATVRRIVQRHGGRVRAEGSPGKGATFFFSLPNDRGAGA